MKLDHSLFTGDAIPAEGWVGTSNGARRICLAGSAGVLLSSLKLGLDGAAAPPPLNGLNRPSHLPKVTAQAFLLQGGREEYEE
jgi:hypothetical protein